MRRYRNALILGIVLFSGLLLSHPIPAVTPYDDVLVQQAVKDLQQENLEEALDGLTQAWQKGTRTPEKAFLLGVVYRRMLNYLKAREYFEAALGLKPDFPEARRLLADTLVALDKPDLALPHLLELEKIGYQPGPTEFLLGMVAAKQKRYSEAVEYFRKAQQDPAMAQEARLQMSLVLAAQNRLKEAKKALEEIISLAPQTDTAGFAQRYAAALEKRIKEVRPFRFYASLGLDFDSNVTVQPGDPSSAQLVSGKGDMAYTYAGAFEYNFFPYSRYGLLAQYAVMQNFHPRLSKFDVLSNTAGLVPTYQFQNSKLWFPLSYNYTDVENDKYYTAFLMAPTYLYLLTSKVGLEASMRAAKKYYWWPVNIQEDNRTAQNYGGSLGVYYFLKNQEGFLQARISYEHDFAQGANWDSSSYRLFLMALYPFTSKLKGSTFVDMLLQPFDNRWLGATNPTSPIALHSKRYDKIFIYGVNLTYEFYKGLEFNVHYYYVRDDSNIALYDYVRHIVGCQLGYRY